MRLIKLTFLYTSNHHSILSFDKNACSDLAFCGDYIVYITVMLISFGDEEQHFLCAAHYGRALFISGGIFYEC